MVGGAQNEIKAEIMGETMEIRCICVPVAVRAGRGGGLSSRSCRSKRHAGTGNMERERQAVVAGQGNKQTRCRYMWQ